MTTRTSIDTLGKLRASGYRPESIGEELRRNLISRLQHGEQVFAGIWGYEETVIPEIERAILAGHNINLLGLRGQAKTRIARMMVNLLDEYIPVITGSELNDDPLQPLSHAGKRMVDELGDATPVSWLHREERYTEKLATPDVTVADLIGDVDPIKAATLKLPYSDERVIHFGLIPRAHRGIFVINELPDLQARIQVSLFNILQEGDIQIRGFRLRLPLDIRFVFTANPEDYTNRGSIVTPLKDRIGSQIITHYPSSIAIGRKITEQEATLHPVQRERIHAHDLVRDLVEQIAIEARKSEYVDAKSGVSARLTISAFENLISGTERRMLINGEQKSFVRIADFAGVIPAITGKVELVYEGEQEGPAIVARNLTGKAIRERFLALFPDPEKSRKQKDSSPYRKVIDWFNEGQLVDITTDLSASEYALRLRSVNGLEKLVRDHHPEADSDLQLLLMEFALHGLAEYSLIGRTPLTSGLRFKDLISGMFNPSKLDDLAPDDEEEGGDEDDDDGGGGGRKGGRR